MPPTAVDPVDGQPQRPHARLGRSSARALRNRQVFLNVPFDDVDGFEDCFLAYVAGLVSLGLRPRSVLEIPSGGQDRLTRIFRLMRGCRYSVHDLSRIQLRNGRYPRFNMPFELGLATALALTREPVHGRYVFAAGYRIVQEVASDLGGVDVYEHPGRARGVMTALANAFVRWRHRPTIDAVAVHEVLRDWVEAHCRRVRPRRRLFEPATFSDIVFIATGASAENAHVRPGFRPRKNVDDTAHTSNVYPS